VPRSTTRSVSLPEDLSQLTFETGNPSFELVYSVPERCHLTLHELPRPVTDPLVNLGRGLLQRFARKAIVKHS
jgi:hypothetical protein